MLLVGTRNQATHDYGFRADGKITSGGTSQLILPEATSRSSLLFQNTSVNVMWLEFGAGRAHATLTAGAITSVTVDNAGFGYTLVPLIELFGGGGQTPFVGIAQPGFPVPQAIYGSNFRPAKLRPVLSGSTIGSIAIDDPGVGYLVAPYVHIRNQLNDPNGCADPSVGSGSGMQLNGGDSVNFNGTAMVTDPIAVYCATTNSTFFCLYTL